jgi:hypothetical protein
MKYIKSFSEFINEKNSKTVVDKLPEVLKYPTFIMLRQNYDNSFSIRTGIDVKSNKNMIALSNVNLADGMISHPKELPGDHAQTWELSEALVDKILKNKSISEVNRMYTLTFNDETSIKTLFNNLKREDDWTYKGINCFRIFKNYNACKEYISNFNISDFI